MSEPMTADLTPREQVARAIRAADVEAAARRVMDDQECKVVIDSGDCLSCGTAPCGPHPDFAYCETHDWIDPWAPNVTLCQWAVRVASAALGLTVADEGRAEA